MMTKLVSALAASGALAAPAAMQLSRFDFASGNPTVVNAAIEGYGLWTDMDAALDRIFADGVD